MNYHFTIASIREASDRVERQHLLEQWRSRFHYRLSRYSHQQVCRRFRVENATVWQLLDTEGKCHVKRLGFYKPWTSELSGIINQQADSHFHYCEDLLEFGGDWFTQALNKKQ